MDPAGPCNVQSANATLPLCRATREGSKEVDIPFGVGQERSLQSTFFFVNVMNKEEG